jgi:hypothetical protein
MLNSVMSGEVGLTVLDGNTLLLIIGFGLFLIASPYYIIA